MRRVISLSAKAKKGDEIRRQEDILSLAASPFAVVAGVIALGLLSQHSTFAQTPGPGVACAVNITNPPNSATVGLTGNVGGTATIPPTKYLWIFAKIGGYQNQGWYPEGQGTATVTNGTWNVLVTYGIPADRGDFQIVAEILDAPENQRLTAWVANANANLVYKPIALPAPASGCSRLSQLVDRIVVTRP